MINPDDYNENLEIGKKYEIKFIDKLKSWGRKAKRYVVRFGKKEAQIIELTSGVWVRCPDIQVYENSNNRSIILRVEVKSLSKFYNDYANKVYGSDPEEDYVTISKEAFDDYLFLMESEEVDVDVVFYIIGRDLWLWKPLYELANMYRLSGKAYTPKDSRVHYVWKASDMNDDFTKFKSE